MTDKQMEEKKEQFVLDTNSLLERELTENDLDIIFGWIEGLVEEVEREAMKEGWNRAVLTVNDAEQERLKYLKKWLPIKAKEIETN